MHPMTFVLCAIAPSRLCVIVFRFNEKGAETRRVLSIAVFTSFALLHIQLTITEITGFLDSARFSGRVGLVRRVLENQPE